MSISSACRAPTSGMSLYRPKDERVDREDDSRKSEAVGEDGPNVEQLEGVRDGVADAVRSPEKLHDQNDLPHQREARSRRRGDVRRKLRQQHMARPCAERKAIDLAHLVKSRVERSRPLAHNDDDVRKL